MAYEFRLPDIGEGMVEGEIVKWHVKEGEAVREDQPMVDVMTDKATVTIPAPRAGKIQRILAREGEVAKVGATLIEIETNGVSPQPAASPRRPASPVPVPVVTAPATEKALATPAVRKLARELGVDLGRIQGSGPGGRISQEDVERAARPAGPPPPSPVRAMGGLEERVPFRGLRKKIAEKMAASKAHIPHFTYVEEADVTSLVALREKADPLAARQGLKLTYLPFIMKGLVAALKQYPALNAVLDESRQEIVLKRFYNLGIGAATPDGLTVFVVKNVESKNIWELARELATLSDKARAGTLSLDELAGGTFTITSLGPLGGILATPIINYPEVGILGVHRIRQRPVVRGGRIVIREMANLSLSLDHRVVDGHVGAEFLAALIRYLEEPALLFLEML